MNYKTKKNLNFKFFTKLTWWVLIASLIIQALSMLGYAISFLNTSLFFIILAASIILSIRKLEYGALIVLAELVIGNRGYLFSIGMGDKFVLSLRLALFVSVMLIWLIKAIKEKEARFLSSKFLVPYIVLIVFIFVGAGIGYKSGNSLSAIFYDFNGYLYLAFIFVLFDAFKDLESLKKLIRVFIGATLAISIITLFFFGDFTFTKQYARPDISQGIQTESASLAEAEKAGYALGGIINKFDDGSGKPFEYRYVRDTGVGSIAYVSGPFFRVYTPGQLMALAAMLFSLFLLLKNKIADKKEKRYLILLFLITSAAIIISFSRSFWIGGAGGFIFILFNLPLKKSLKIATVLIVLICLLTLASYFIAPTAFNLMKSRVTSIFDPGEELASQNRINLLKPIMVKIKNHPLIGEGFGTWVIYESVVPEKQGYIKVFAYEWGYLDMMVKIGLLGTLTFLWFVISIIVQGYKLENELAEKSKFYFKMLIGLFAGLIAMLVTNLTSPYLNHPLGIGIIIICAVFVFILSNETSKSHNLPTIT